MPVRRLLFFFVLLAAFAMLSLSPAAAETLFPPVRVSGSSPFANCSTGTYGTLYSNAETEPSIAVNPTNHANTLGAWQQDRWSNGASLGVVAGYSFDAGQSWTEVPLPFTSCARGGLSYDRASDPWVSFGPDGTAYASAVVLGKSGTSGVVAATSRDGGKSWTNAREVIVDGGSTRQYFDDKSAITADPTAPGVAYAVWDRLESRTGGQESGQRSGPPRASAYFSMTGDGGQSWSKPKAITSADAGEATGNQIVVDRRTGVLYDFFDLITQPSRGRMSYTIAFVKSLDGGDSWSKPKNVAEIRLAPVQVPNSRASVRAGGILPEIAIDPGSGTLYVVWMDSRFANGGYPEVAISASDDGGDKWSTPSRVNTPSGGPAFTPGVSVADDGTVAVTYYDFRNRTAQTSTLPTDYWATFSRDGGASFEREIHLAGPFDILTAPNSGGYFLGDYQGLAATRDFFITLFVGSNSADSEDRTDVFALALIPAREVY